MKKALVCLAGVVMMATLVSGCATMKRCCPFCGKGKKAEMAATCAGCGMAKADCKCPKDAAAKCAGCGMAKAACTCPKK